MTDSDAAMVAMLAEWNAVSSAAQAAEQDADTALVQRWERSVADLTVETGRLKAEGRWLTGPPTLLAAIGVHHRELPLVAALGWLLSPDGYHGLGDRVLAAFLAHLRLRYDRTVPVTIRLEQTRRDATGATRADLVVRVGGTVVVVEAKIYTTDHHGQCDRLAWLWGHEKPTLVYLTRWRESPTDAPQSGALWNLLAWSDVADMVEKAASGGRPSAGAQELLTTLRMFHSDVGSDRGTG